ncbi:MAG: translation elongation factor Ts [Hyphomicrobium sp.]|jgi:elongation factor Ts|uniref:translation elongation factor Ts n=1 Tax=Hyphomicrobium sp. TaxID=82 RepID=UPI0025BD5C63|nr:translation elongation factor Ts [Hyphomicrobium sp.]MBX9861844.1 translation elongation factor Ts [Hyphomicrobium sp.]
MSTISAAAVKELRDKTGAGMMDCKQALTETNGDMEAAIDLLRKKGLSKAAKKSDRVAAQGLIGVISKVKSGAVVEVNSETDFVARNPQFQELVQTITSLAPAANGNLANLLEAKYPGGESTVDHQIKDAIATIGENMALRRTASLSVKEGVVADYVHNKAADGLGKIGVLIALESAGDSDSLMALGRQLAMHIAAANPQVVNVEDLSKDALDRERAIYLEQAKAEPKNAGKSDEILLKAGEGRLQKEFVSQAVLLKQVFVIDGKASVAEILKQAEKTVGAPVKVSAFVRYQLGEGIEKKEEDFAAEVAKSIEAAQK